MSIEIRERARLPRRRRCTGGHDQSVVRLTESAFRSRFASLASVHKAVVPVLAQHGICITRRADGRKAVACSTTLTHESGPNAVRAAARRRQSRRAGFRAPPPMPAAMPSWPSVRLSVTSSTTPILPAKPAGAVAFNAGKGIGIHSPLGDVQVDDRAVGLCRRFPEARRTVTCARWPPI